MDRGGQVEFDSIAGGGVSEQGKGDGLAFAKIERDRLSEGETVADEAIGPDKVDGSLYPPHRAVVSVEGVKGPGNGSQSGDIGEGLGRSVEIVILGIVGKVESDNLPGDDITRGEPDPDELRGFVAVHHPETPRSDEAGIVALSDGDGEAETLAPRHGEERGGSVSQTDGSSHETAGESKKLFSC
jgi:hypothetical protein